MKKTIELLEAASLSAYDKMRLFDIGERRENLKACGGTKLLNYYRLCLNNGFTFAEEQIAKELIERGLDAWVVPQVSKLTAEEFTPYEAKFILENKDFPAKVLEAAEAAFTGFTESENLVVYLVWAIALEVYSVADAIKILMQSYQTYFNRMPDILNSIMKNTEIMSTITKILNDIDKEAK